MHGKKCVSWNGGDVNTNYGQADALENDMVISLITKKHLRKEDNNES